MDSKGDLEAAGPTLYLESGDIDPTETFCTEVFDDEKKGEYRVVQLTATQSFESVSDELNARLEHIEDPSEAAVIITTPQDDEETTATQVGEATPLYGFRVSPEDLTGISIAFSQIIERWEKTEGSVKICLRDLESLFPYHDTELLYRFLNTVLATLQGAGADVHMHLRPAATDEQALQMISSLFAEVVEADASPLEAESGQDAGTGTGSADAPGQGRTDSDAKPDHKDAGSESGEAAASTMSEEEIETFLGEEGYGTLAFGGDSPYAIPMSYGYDPDERALYMQLSAFEGSEKQARMDGATPVSFVVSRYDRSDQWRSVVVEGTLTELAEEDIEKDDVLDAFSGSDLATVDVFDRDLSGISFGWYVLRPESMSGRQSTR
jgi:hypothetical protein